MQSKPSLGWFEVITENYFEAHGGYVEYLQDLSKTYKIRTHGVSLSIGSTDQLNETYLKKLKNFAEKIKPETISDHVCYTGVNHKNTHDLLPIPYTKQALEHISDRVKKVQDFLGRRIALENPSSYVEFSNPDYTEWEFIRALGEKADCELLLDVNNIYVASFNHNYDPIKYIDAIPADRVAYIHLAGHTKYENHIIDTHNNYVIDEVWKLYEYAIKTKGVKPTMLEWDSEIPEFSVLYDEIMKAKKIVEKIEVTKNTDQKQKIA